MLSRDERTFFLRGVLQVVKPGFGESFATFDSPLQDIRAYGNMGKEVRLNFKSPDLAQAFLGERLQPSSARPSYLNLKKERVELWWNRKESPLQYRRGKHTGMACSAVHKLQEALAATGSCFLIFADAPKETQHS